MSVELKMPALSPTMEEGTLARWLVKEGDSVKPGDVLAEIETDKATMEFEAIDEGVVARLLIQEGSEGVKVGTVIAELSSDEEPVAKVDKELAPVAQAKPVVQKPAVARTEQAAVYKQVVPAAQTDGMTTVREALRDAMAAEMRADPRVFVIGEEVAQYQGAYKVTQGLLDEFGARRVIDTPITEYGFAGVGTGAAMGGLRPIVEFMTFNFAMQAIDHIINSAAKTNYMSGGQMRCPIVFRGPNGAASRVGAQHSQNFAPWYASVPGIVVVAPYDAADCYGLMRSSIQSEDPVVFLENELVYGRSFEAPAPDHIVPIGKARTARSGSDITLVSYSIGVGIALQAAEDLAGQGVDAEVIDLRTLRPMDDAAILESLKRTNRLVVVEEGWPACSISSEIAAMVMEKGFDDLDAPIIRVTNEDVPLPYAANLEKAALVNADKVVAATLKLLNR